MKIKGTTTTVAEVEISDYDLIHAVIQFVYRKKKWGYCDRDRQIGLDLEGNLTLYEEVGGGSHSWTEKTKLGEATDCDKSAIQTIAYLNMLLFRQDKK